MGGMALDNNSDESLLASPLAYKRNSGGGVIGSSSKQAKPQNMAQYLTGLGDIASKINQSNFGEGGRAQSSLNLYKGAFRNGMYEGTNPNALVGGDTSFLEQQYANRENPNYALRVGGIVDQLALHMYQSDVSQGNEYTRWASGHTLGPALFSIEDTHMDSLNYDDKWLRVQSQYLKKASDVLKQYGTQNEDGTYNLNLAKGTELGSATRGFETYKRDSGREYWSHGERYTEYEDARRDVYGLKSDIKYDNVKLFSDFNQAYDYAKNENSFLRSLKESALTYFAEGKYGEWQGSSDLLQSVGLSKNNMLKELSYSKDGTVGKRRADVEQYKRNKSKEAELKVRGSGPGAGIDPESALRLNTPTLLGF
jgi:hypothetical protein